MSPSALTAVAGITALVGALKGMVGIGKSILNITAGFESVQAGLKTATGDAKSASAVFEQLRKLSYETTFGMEELAKAATFLLNAGQGADTINKSLLMLGNLATGDRQKFIDLSNVYTKILNIGKAGAEQLEMLALRGIPIKQTLKEMGVVGTASAQDITKAFEKLTEEGGKFAGAMDNMNETIEGKRGFISDTLKEIAVNFGEVSGLTETYKILLEALRVVLDQVNNVLIAINNNPLLKNIVSGILAGAMTALVVLITGKLIGALKAVISNLKQMVIFQSISAALTGNVSALAKAAAVAGIAVGGVVSITKMFSTATEISKEKLEEENAELERKIKLKQQLGELPVDSPEYRSSSVKYEELRVKELEQEIAKMEKELALPAYTSPQDWAGKSGRIDLLLGNPKELDAEYKRAISLEGNLQKEQIEQKKIALENRKNELAASKELLEYENQVVTAKEAINNLGINVFTKEEAELKALQEKLDIINSNKDVKTGFITYEKGKPVVETQVLYEVDPSYKKQVDDAEAYINSKIRDINIKIAISSGSDWQKTLQNSLGLSDNEAVDGDSMKNSKGMLEAFNTKWNEYLQNDLGDAEQKQMEYLSKAVGALDALTKANLNLKGNDKFKLSDNAVSELIRNITSSFDKTLEQVKLNGIDGTQTKVLKDLIDKFEVLKDILGASNPIVEEILQKLKGANLIPGENDTEGIAEKSFKNTFASASSDLQNFITGLQQGGFWGGVINATVEALYKVCSGIEGFEEALNPVTTLIGELSELISFLTEVTAQNVKAIKAVATIVNTMLKVLRPLLNLYLLMNERLANFLDWIAGGFETIISSIFFWVDANDEEADAKKEEAERLKRLNEQYSALYSALKEQEEWYLNKQYQIKGQESIEKAVGVNDMILTPQGVFSTHPEDTIMAMKHPENLMSSGSQVVINVNNNANVQVKANSDTDSNGNTVIDIDVISQSVADDFASGYNGWDYAVESQQKRLAGRAISL